jgi:ABC-type cobalamin/Fe3+-siderophores transport system ATPase subunit
VSALLELRNIALSYGTTEVLRSVTWRAGGGEFVALLGINGAGKSTLLDVVAGIRSPASGEVWIVGRPHAEWTPRELSRHISHLPQAVHADLPFSAEQLVAMGRYPHTDRWFESEADHAAVDRAMRRTNSAGQRRRAFATLSGGERQRVLLAACLAQDARILLLDEPSTFLDIEQQIHCFALLREEAESGRLCVAVTHDINLALTYCTRLVVLSQGIVACDMASSQAHEDTSWLSIFSARLHLARTPEGSPWVWYR